MKLKQLNFKSAIIGAIIGGLFGVFFGAFASFFSAPFAIGPDMWTGVQQSWWWFAIVGFILGIASPREKSMKKSQSDRP